VDILAVDDGSTDGTWAAITEMSRANPLVNGVRLSRNFGKESAIFAGLEKFEKAKGGDCVIVMDADMQHPPETAVEMFGLWLGGGYAIVEGIKIRRQKESRLKRAGARLFYFIFGKSAGLDMGNTSDFKLLDRGVVALLTKMPERSTFFRAMANWTGLPTAKVFYEVGKRAGGKTKWRPFSLFRLAFGSIASYTAAPLHIVTFAGVLFFVFAVVLGAQSLWAKFSGRSTEGFTTVILLLLIIGGVLMTSLGIIGVYIAKIYEEVKYRPRYIIAEAVGTVYGRRES